MKQEKDNAKRNERREARMDRRFLRRHRMRERLKIRFSEKTVRKIYDACHRIDPYKEMFETIFEKCTFEIFKKAFFKMTDKGKYIIVGKNFNDTVQQGLFMLAVEVVDDETLDKWCPEDSEDFDDDDKFESIEND